MGPKRPHNRDPFLYRGRTVQYNKMWPVHARYPDGKCYLKLGHGNPYDEQVRGKAGLEGWYRRRPEGNPEAVEQLSAFIRSLIPDLEVIGVKVGACVTAQVCF